MDVAFVAEAEDELAQLPSRERIALLHAVEKLEAIGDQLPYPHSSAVKNSNLRELRPRGGRSRWRALYRRIGDVIVIAAIGPEAQIDPRGFARAVSQAEIRLNTIVSEEN